jgi:hypothetical protein
MYRVTLYECVKLAKDFIKKDDLVNADLPGTYRIKPRRTKEAGALIRASMELTRKLADLRQNR